MVKNWRNSAFVAKFLTKFALFDERKICIFGGKILWSLLIVVVEPLMVVLAVMMALLHSYQ